MARGEAGAGPRDDASDAILIEGIRIPAALGVTAAERRLRRPVLIDLELGRSLARSGRTDRLGDTVDYGAVYAVVDEVVGGGEHRLVEALAERVVAALFARFALDRITVTLRKVAPLAGAAERAGVRITRRRPA